MDLHTVPALAVGLRHVLAAQCAGLAVQGVLWVYMVLQRHVTFDVNLYISSTHPHPRSSGYRVDVKGIRDLKFSERNAF